MVISVFHQRLLDLEDNVAKDFKLLKEFEDVLRHETNPRIKARYRQDMEELRESATYYQQQYDELKQQLVDNNSFTQVKSLEYQLHQLEVKLNALLSTQDDMFQNIDRIQQILLQHYKSDEKVMVATIMEQLNPIQLTFTQKLLEAIEANRISEGEMQQMLGVLEERIPSLPFHQVEVSKIIKSPELDLKHKLKISLPIVPFLIDYEGELEIGSGFNIQSAWKHLLSKLRKK